MNNYGMQAKAHWQRWLPTRYASLPDPDRHFTELGQQVAAQIGDLTMRLAGPDQPGEGYLEKVGRLNAARAQAQEIVLRESVLLEPEPGMRDLNPDEREDPTEPEPTAELAMMVTDWAPVVEDPTSSYWSRLGEQEQTS